MSCNLFHYDVPIVGMSDSTYYLSYEMWTASQKIDSWKWEIILEEIGTLAEWGLVHFQHLQL